MDKQHVVFLGALFFVTYGAGATQSIKNAAANQANRVLSQDLVQQSQSKNGSSVLAQVQSLRRDGYLTAATKIAIDYLNKYPNDGDIRFILGSIQQEQKKLPLAKKNFNQVLKQYPSYLDARLSLIRIHIAEKKYSEASSLIKEGLKINPNEERLARLKQALITEQNNARLVSLTKKMEYSALSQANIMLNNDAIKQESANAASSSFSIVAQIQTLRQGGYLNTAAGIASNYLKNHPTDGDVRFLLGAMQVEQKKLALAKINFNQVLKQFPAYLDARLSLVRLYIAEKNYSEAYLLIQQGLKINSKEARLLTLQRVLITEQTNSKSASLAKKKAEPPALTLEQKNLEKARLYAQKGQYQEQLRFLRPLVASNEENIAYRLALATYYIEHKDPMLALDIVNKGLKIHPKNVDLLLKKGEVNNYLYQYPQAAAAFHEVLQIAPDNTLAPRAIEEINTINPFYNYGINEVGFYTDNAYVQDLHSIWDYSTVYYMRDINKGRIGGRVNFASRLGMNAAQYELDYSPRLSQNAYFDLAAAYSDEPALFPNWMGRGEGFLKVASNAEISAGIQYSKIASTYFNTYTSSISLYLGNNLLSFKPYFFIPKSNDKSTLYTATIRHYFDVGDHFINISGGSGTSPDIADLLTVNFIIIQNSFINFNYEFPILNHLLVVDVGAGYQRWVYPSQLIRNLYDAKVGIKYRF